jgi:hypothetical protein
MGRWTLSLIAGMVGLLLWQMGAWAQESRLGVGKVVRTQGDCSAEFAGAARGLKTGAEVYYQDLLKTGDGARLAARLADDSELTLGAGATLLVDEFVYRSESSGGRLSLQVLKGAFLFVGGKLDSNQDATVRIGTLVGTLGIRGTTVWGGMIDGEFAVLVIEGEVDVTNDGGRVVLGAGEGTMVAGAGVAPTAPKKWPQAKIDRAFATVSFADN